MKRLQKWRDILSRAQIPVYSANAAFFLLLSAFPTAGLLLPLLRRLALSNREFFAVFSPLMPMQVTGLFRAAPSASGLSLSALAALWSASRGSYALLQGLRNICRLEEHRNYLLLRLLAIGYTFFFLAALLATFAAYSLGRALLQLLRAVESPFGKTLRFLLLRRGGIAFSFLTALFLLIFRTFPPEKRSFRQALPGSLLTAGGWVGFSRLFSLWVAHFSDYSRVYGSAATFAISMLWLYFCLYIVLLGALVNEEIIKARRA